MQITLERSGGYTGIPLTITVDTTTLSPEKVNQLRHLVEAVDFDHVPISSKAAQPDRVAYTITVRDGDRTRTIAFEDAAIPEPLKSLVRWLMETDRPR